MSATLVVVVWNMNRYAICHRYEYLNLSLHNKLASFSFRFVSFHCCIFQFNIFVVVVVLFFVCLLL